MTSRPATSRPTTSRIDFQNIRADFPALQTTMHGEPLVYLDNGATSQKPRAVLDATTRVYEKLNANVHRGAYQLSQLATDEFEAVRGKVAHFIGAQKFHEIIFTRGTTESINLVASSWGPAHLKPWNEILVTRMEHHSNFVPWQSLAHRTGAKFKICELTPEYEIDLEAFRAALASKPRIVAFTMTSNVLGTRNPVAEMAALAKAAGALVVVDAAQGIPHEPVSIEKLGPIDFLAFSSHKICGPTGVGVLWGREELLRDMPPVQFGGDMILNVQDQTTQWNDLPWKFEAGTPNIAGVIGLGAAIDYLNSIGMAAIHARVTALTRQTILRLADIPGVHLIGPGPDHPNRGAAVSFVVDGVHPHDLSTFLDTRGIAIRAGHHCAQPLMSRLNLTATARASVSFYNTESEIDFLAKSIAAARDYFVRPRSPAPKPGARS
jgi:cysteine desulfurase/selenocysteine lyase